RRRADSRLHRGPAAQRNAYRRASPPHRQRPAGGDVQPRRRGSAANAGSATLYRTGQSGRTALGLGQPNLAPAVVGDGPWKMGPGSRRDGGLLKELLPGFVPPVAVETGGDYVGRGEGAAVDFMVVITPSKNVAHGPLRTC